MGKEELTRKPNTSYLYRRTTDEERNQREKHIYGLELYDYTKLNPELFTRKERAILLKNLAGQAVNQKIPLITEGHTIITIDREVRSTMFQNVISIPVGPGELEEFIEYYKQGGGR